MNAVMISIRPEWCAKIANGEKTIEVRKTKPKLQPPFKCYIYETQGKTETPWIDEDGHMIFKGRGQVIGEFVCDKILDIAISISNPEAITGYEFPCTGLTDKEIMNYLGNGRTGYGWHISALKIYDTPKNLSEFCCLEKTENWAFPKRITRPPQSWCYVKENTDE